MPQEVQFNYKLTGPSTVMIYTQSEMAEAMAVAESELINQIESGYIGLAYHAHPLATGNGYWFTPEIYRNNCIVWNCIQENGKHEFVFDHWYDESAKKAVRKCSLCGYHSYD